MQKNNSDSGRSGAKARQIQYVNRSLFSYLPIYLITNIDNSNIITSSKNLINHINYNLIE